MNRLILIQNPYPFFITIIAPTKQPRHKVSLGEGTTIAHKVS
ncbi:MAG: hypothetical protein OEX01_04765 [Candidatus Bathyarchaeota archaeon]|nr:hypothetical protein [Candidatus Bathyarchaeota archaeon]